MPEHQDRLVAALMERLIAHGPEQRGEVFAALVNLALRLERERFLGAGLSERTPERRASANGSKKLDTPAGTVTVEGPTTRGHDGAPVDPQALERGRRSCRAVMLAVAEMSAKGVSTRDAAGVMAAFGLEGLASTQVSRAAALLDEALQAWRERPLGACPYLVLDARKVRAGGIVRDAAVLTAVGSDPDGRRRLLGVSCALAEAEGHRRGFLAGLVARGRRGVVDVVSDDHAGLRAARRAVLPGATWQRGQVHLALNAIPQAPTLASRRRIGAELRRVSNAATRADAEAELKRLVAADAEAAPDLAAWLEANVPEGLAAFTRPEGHRRRLRTANPIARAVQQELKRRTGKVRVVPSRDALLRLVSAVLAAIDDEWLATDRRSITWEDRDAGAPRPRISRHQVA